MTTTAAYSPVAQSRRRLRHVAVVWVLFAIWPLVARNDYVLSLGIYFFINLLLIGGLNLVMGFGGQISLCQAGFYGLGAYLSGALSVRYGWPPALGVVIATAGSAFAALLIGLPALRLRGHYLAMATLGFNAILSVLFNELVGLTGGPNGLSGIPPIAFGSFSFGTAGRFFWLAWATGPLVMLITALLLASRQGRALRAVAGSEIAADSMGVDPFRAKLAAFMLSAALAGLAGALYAHFNLYASPETFSFSTSVLLVVMVALGGWGHYWGPVFGAILFTAVPELLHGFQDAELLVFGLGMIAVLLFLPGGIAGIGSAFVPAVHDPSRRCAMQSLEVSGVSVVFGGLAAVDDLSFSVEGGSIKGVIGPNGAGKTTLFNVIAGVIAPTAGRVRLHGADITGLRPHRRAALGLSRTFQNLQIFPEMSVLENVMLGAHTKMHAGWAAGLLGLGGREERRAEETAHQHLVTLGLGERAGEAAGNLGFADAKLLEIARALASEPRVLLLDEPIAGVPLAEQNRVVEVIRRVNAGGVTIVLVEHNMRVVMGLCSDVLVVNYGKRLAEGDPASVARHPDVIRAYLGAEVAGA